MPRTHCFGLFPDMCSDSSSNKDPNKACHCSFLLFPTVQKQRLIYHYYYVRAHFLKCSNNSRQIRLGLDVNMKTTTRKAQVQGVPKNRFYALVIFGRGLEVCQTIGRGESLCLFSVPRSSNIHLQTWNMAYANRTWATCPAGSDARNPKTLQPPPELLCDILPSHYQSATATTVTATATRIRLSQTKSTLAL